MTRAHMEALDDAVYSFHHAREQHGNPAFEATIASVGHPGIGTQEHAVTVTVVVADLHVTVSCTEPHLDVALTTALYAASAAINRIPMPPTPSPQQETDMTKTRLAACLQALAALAQSNADRAPCGPQATVEGASEAADACWDAFDAVCKVEELEPADLRDRFFDSGIGSADLYLAAVKMPA